MMKTPKPLRFTDLYLLGLDERYAKAADHIARTLGVDIVHKLGESVHKRAAKKMHIPTTK